MLPSCSNSMRPSNPRHVDSPPLFLRRFLALAVLSAAGVLFAQERDYSFADDTVEALQKYKAATEAKDNKLALSILDGLLAKLPPPTAVTPRLCWSRRLSSTFSPASMPRRSNPWSAAFACRMPKLLPTSRNARARNFISSSSSSTSRKRAAPRTPPWSPPTTTRRRSR